MGEGTGDQIRLQERSHATRELKFDQEGQDNDYGATLTDRIIIKDKTPNICLCNPGFLHPSASGIH